MNHTSIQSLPGIIQAQRIARRAVHSKNATHWRLAMKLLRRAYIAAELLQEVTA